MKQSVLIIGAGGVAHVAAHKCAQNNDILGDICIASRTLSKCEDIIDSVKRKNSIKDKSKRLFSRELNAYKVDDTVRLIKEINAGIVINLAQAFLNRHILDACIQSGVAYIDTAIHEEPSKVCEDPPWYANYEWKRSDDCRKNKVTAILGIGFDPGVVNAYCAFAAKKEFDSISSIDIIDVNCGSHKRFFATNFDPEINFREFHKVWTWIDGKWQSFNVHEIKMDYELPVVGKQTVYLTGHDEIHSLSKNLSVPSIRFWMGFSDHYINCFRVLKNIGLLSEKPVKMPDGSDVVPLQLLKAVLPDPKSLAAEYDGVTVIGNDIKGVKDGKDKQIFIYNLCDHKKCYDETESQAISYTAGVPAAAAAILIKKGAWDVKKMVNVEELNPEPFIELIGDMGLKTEIIRGVL